MRNRYSHLYNMSTVLNSFMCGELIQIVRTAQGISQVRLAASIGVTQAAIASYESGRRHTLSLQNLQKLAPFINLNPGFFENKALNPFKQVDSAKPITIFLTEDLHGRINYDILRIIAARNLMADVVLLRVPELPDEPKSITKQKIKGNTICAFAIRDTSGNFFLFRKKTRASLFNEEYLNRFPSATLFDMDKPSGPTADGCSFFMRTVDISPQLYDQILGWSEIDARLLSPLFQKTETKETLAFIKTLVEMIWSRSLPYGSGVISDRHADKNTILAAAENLGEEYYAHCMPNLIGDLKVIMGKYTLLKKG